MLIWYICILQNDYHHGSGSNWEDGNTGWPSSWPRGFGGPTSSPALGMWVLTTVPTAGAIFKDAALGERVLLRPSGMYMWMNPNKPSM